MVVYRIVDGLIDEYAYMYNDVWNWDNDDGLFNGYVHVWKYMMIVIDDKHDIT